MTKLANISKYIINIIFIIIIVLSILSFININNLFNYNGIFILAGYTLILYMIIFLYKKFSLLIEKKHKIILIIVTVIGIILSLVILFQNYYVNFDDYGSNFNNAVSFAKSSKFLSPNTVNLFPHVSGYILFLSLMFRLFSCSIKVVIIFNLIFHFGAAYFLYLITKKLFSKDIALLTYAFYLLNPIPLIWCTMPIGITIFNFFLSVSYYFSYKLLDKTDDKKNYILLSIVLGIIFAISNLFRPVMSIFVIAFVILLLIKKNFKVYKENIISITLILSVFLLINNIYSQTISTLINEPLPKIKYGWAVYLGANYEYGGLWNMEDAQFLANQSSKEKATDIQKNLLDLGIKRFKANGINKNLELFKYKFVTLMGKSGRYTADSYLATKKITSSFNPEYNNSKSVIICNLFNFALLVMTSITSIKLLKSQKKEILLLQLYIIGILIPQFFMEISARYTLSFLIPYFILAFGFLSNEKARINS